MLFDSLGHATVDGTWLDSELDASFAKYSKELEKNDYQGGLVVGLSGKNSYSHSNFLELANKYENLYPVAGYNPLNESIEMLAELKNNGFVGIKIHPRFSKIDLHLEKEKLIECFKKCEELNLPIFLCTYFHCSAIDIQQTDPFFSFLEIYKKAPETKVVLVHGGVHDLMKYADLSRFNDGLIIDLSLTMMKYRGSSLDLDLNFLFRHFDRKICVGSDYPEYNLKEIKDRFEELSLSISNEKKNNISHKNIKEFLNIK